MVDKGFRVQLQIGLKLVPSSSVVEPGAVEPPYFVGAGAKAVIFVKNGSGSAKNRDFSLILIW